MNGWFDIKDVQPHETGKIWVAYIEPVLIDGKYETRTVVDIAIVEVKKEKKEVAWQIKGASQDSWGNFHKWPDSRPIKFWQPFCYPALYPSGNWTVSDKCVWQQ